MCVDQRFQAKAQLGEDELGKWNIFDCGRLLIVIVLNTIIVATCIQVVALVQAKPQYEVQVQSPVSFSYTTGNQNQLFDGTCCSPNETNSCSSNETNCCFTACNETQIILCFREAQHSTNDSDSTNCPLGMATFLFDTVANITYSSTANLTTTTTYTVSSLTFFLLIKLSTHNIFITQGSFQLFYKVVALQPVKEIDHGAVITLNYTVQDTFMRPIVNSGEQTFLLIRGIRVVCREGYFGPDCGCSTRNDSTGHFTCDTNSTKVCFPGYQNPETNCVEEERSTQEPAITMSSSLATTTISSRSAIADIIPIIGGGVAGGLLVLLLMLTVNVVLVVAAIKFKFTAQHSRAQGICMLNIQFVTFLLHVILNP